MGDPARRPLNQVKKFWRNHSDYWMSLLVDYLCFDWLINHYLANSNSRPITPSEEVATTSTAAAAATAAAAEATEAAE